MKLKRKISVRWGVFSGFAVFTVIIIALLWVSQILLLDTFYKNYKIREIRNAGDRIVASIDDPNLDVLLTDITQTKEINVLVTADNGMPLILSPYSQSSVIFKGFIPQYAAIFQETEQAGGIIFKSYNNELSADPDANPNNMILARTAVTENGAMRLILLHSNLTPVDSTVSTLRFQLYCITAIMLLLGGILAIVLATGITRPIVKINRSANRLAAGDYGIAFEESGYRELSELAKTLNHTSAELSKVENLRRELLANVSHDLRTPLTMIAGYSEVMRDIPGENTPENMQIVIDETNRLTALVNDMLDLSKLQSGAIPVEYTVFSITDLLKETVARFSKMADYSFAFHPDENLFVKADVSKISQVIYNLINNAVIHSGEDKTVTLRQSRNGEIVRIEVTDHGPGIPQDRLPDIWDRYYKADRTEKNTKGTGLGLSIVKTVLELHRASYGVQSQVGEGSTFWFELLLSAPQEQTANHEE